MTHEVTGPSRPAEVYAWLQALFEESPMAIGFSRDGVMLDANPAYVRLFGYASSSDLRGRSILDQIAPSHRAQITEMVALRAHGGSPPNRYETRGLRKDGTEFPFEVTTTRVLVADGPLAIAFITDVSEQRALATRMQQTQKLESLGVLAGGIAHDFNNILTVIANGVALAKRDRGLAATSAEYLEGVVLAARRGADLCRQMLAYAGKAAFSPEGVDLSGLVAEMSSMLEVSITKKATLVRELASGLPMLLGDATQIRQVVMNLVLNASEAVAAPQGKIVVSTGTGTYGAGAFARSAAGGDPKPGTYVYLEVRDDGVGMDGSTVSQMFDPFFTTKFTGRGLGMAAVLGIVRGHAGAIDVESSPGRGTRIRVFFPAAAPSIAAKAAGRSLQPEPDLRGQGVVLLVDDEETVRVLTQSLLNELGFEVMVARDGVEGIEAFRTQSRRIGAVVLDLNMPRMDGFETLRELRRIAPEVPVVLTSGYGATPLEDSQSASQPDVVPDAVLGKPYDMEQLFAALQRVMRAAS
jgi:PAS domain S-box-containing protein